MRNFIEGIRKKNWTVKIIPKWHSEISVLHFSAWDLLRVGTLASVLLLIVSGYFFAQKFQETSFFRKTLETESQQLKRAEQEKEQMESLLNQKANQLEIHLNQLRTREKRIQKMLQGTPMNSMNHPKNQSKLLAYRPDARFGRKSFRGGSSQELLHHLAFLKEQIDQEEEEFNKIQTLAILGKKKWQNFLAVFSYIPSLWPVEGKISSGFGYRVQPLTEAGEFHPGVDITGPYASPVRASAAGRCIFSGYAAGYGFTVKISHGNGFVTQYSHCSRVFLQEGEAVRKGTIVALLGSTGFSTGPHLHYQMFYRGRVINPIPYLGLTPERLAVQGKIQGLAYSPR